MSLVVYAATLSTFEDARNLQRDICRHVDLERSIVIDSTVDDFLAGREYCIHMIGPAVVYTRVCKRPVTGAEVYLTIASEDRGFARSLAQDIVSAYPQFVPRADSCRGQRPRSTLAP